MITLDNISFEFGGRFLYHNASLQIKPGDRIALIGRNGTGKTTLIRLILGEFQPTEGRISIPKSTRIGTLEQEMQEVHTNETAHQVAMRAFSGQLALREEIARISSQLERSDDPGLLRQLAEKQHTLEAMGSYDLEIRVSTILAGLGFSEEDQKAPYNTFSGGWRMRVLLARLLLREPDLLLLDEPTNHLDLPSIQWLENYLKGFPGAFVVVSHDRYFLDRLTNKTVELAREKFNEYKGNYTFYLKEKVQRLELQQSQYDNQQRFIADNEKFINRFRAQATKARQAQSKIKLLEKLERIPAPEADSDDVNISFKAEVQPGKDILHLQIQEKRYGEKLVIGPSEQSIRRGDKIALVGANGLGKSTVLRIITQSEPFEGELITGHNVKPSFFAQHQLEALNPKNDIMEEMKSFSHKFGEGYVRNILGGFLFTGDDVFKKISVLSGGEKSRVALAKTLLSEANFLLLDEPTNHLDIQSIGILIKALQAYNGTYIVVSHDRYFLREVANKIWYIENRELKEYPGSYGEFEYFMQQRDGSANGQSIPAPKKADSNGSDPQADSKTSKDNYKAEKEKKRKQEQLSRNLEKAEESILELEQKKNSLFDQMVDPASSANFELLTRLQKEFDEVEKKLDQTTRSWEKLVEEMENEQ